jgi:DNA-binding NarL/FixJ family response regulator
MTRLQGKEAAMTDVLFRVSVLHREPITALGLRAVLARESGLGVVPADSNDADVIVTDYDDALLRLACERDHPRGGGPRARVVVVTTRLREAEVRRALTLGALGFVCQECAPEELVQAVRSASRRARFLSRAVSESMADGLAHASASLTERETQVLELVASGLCNKLIGSALGIAPATAKSHVRAILDKLGARSRTEAAAIAARRGLLAAHPDPGTRRREFPGSRTMPLAGRRPQQVALQ